MNFILSTTTKDAEIKGLQEALILAEKDINNSIIVIVPETKTVMAERYLLENSKNGAFSNIYICSYNRLLSKLDICNESYLLTREAGVYIIKKLIGELSESLVCYKKAASFLGFAESIYDTITQLKSSGVTPEEFSASARASQGALPSKMMDIALLYDAYENYLSDRYLDMSDSLTEIAKASIDSEFIKQAHIFVLGFASVTHQMDDVILNFVKTAKSVTVSAPYIHPNMKNAHIADNEVYNHYKSVADKLKIQYSPIIIKPNRPSDFKHVESNLLAYPISKQASKGNINIVSFKTIQDEVSAVAIEIAKSVRNGARFRDFGLLVNNLEEYEHEIRRIFDEYNISYFLSKKYDLSKHALLNLISHILEISRLGLDNLHMIAISKNPLITLDGDADAFENFILKTGVNYNGFLSPFVEGDDASNEDKQAEEMRKSIVKMLSGVTDKLKSAKHVKDFVEAINGFFDEFKIQENLESFRDLQEELGENEMAGVTEQVYKKVAASFDCLNKFLGESSAEIQEFSGLLMSGLSSVEISLIPLELDSVIIQTNTDGMWGLEKLYILGATEGKFPISSEDCGIIRDQEINSLSEMFKVKIEPTIRTINRRERYKSFEDVISYNKLWISYSNTSLLQEENSPSSFLLSIAGLFTDFYISDEIQIPLMDVKAGTNLKNEINNIFTTENLEKYFARSVGRIKSNNVGLTNVEISTLYNAIKDKSSFDFNRMLGDESLDIELTNADIYFKNQKTSISELEKYFACPFLHFADYGLRLMSRVESKLKAIDVGDLMHKIAEKFVLCYMKGKDISNLSEQKKIVDEVLYKDENLIKNNRILISILEKESYRLLSAIGEQLRKSEFKPVGVEAWFGENSKYKSIRLADDVRIEGKIDRIDVYGDHFKVIDYKTGKIDESPEALYYGKKVQLLSYIQAIGKDIGKKPAGALYFPVRNEWADSKRSAEHAYKNKGYLLKDEEILTHMDTELLHSNTSSSIPVNFIKAKNAPKGSDARVFGAEGNLLTEKQFEKIIKYIEELEKKAVQEIKSGYTMPSPLVMDKKSPCTYCDYRFVCGLERTKNKDGRRAIDKINFNDFTDGE